MQNIYLGKPRKLGHHESSLKNKKKKLEKKYAPALDNYGQSLVIFKEMCINIIQNIKAVTPKLQKEIAGQTMYLYPDRRTK